MKIANTSNKKKVQAVPAKKTVAASTNKKVVKKAPVKKNVVEIADKKPGTKTVLVPSSNIIQHHKDAIKHHEEAASHHRDVIKHFEAGDHKKAAESRVKAHGFLGFITGLWEKM